jgi:hypothetical protein
MEIAEKVRGKDTYSELFLMDIARKEFGIDAFAPEARRLKSLKP